MPGKTKKCKDCQAEIPSKANRCMHCGSKKGVGCLASSVIIVFSLVLFSYIFSDNNNPDDSLESSAMALCMAHVRASSEFPSSVDFSMLSSPGATSMQNGSWSVTLVYEEKNIIGNTIPRRANCQISGARITYFNAENN